MIAEYANLSKHDVQQHLKQFPSRTRIGVQLLEAWRVAAADPDRFIYKWLRDGAPTGILEQLMQPGICPKFHRPADIQPQDLHCDQQQFKNYPGVEEQDITDAELAAHLAKGHLRAFDTHAELADFFNDDEPIMSKLGLIIKTPNCITKARMILDTKQSGVKRITSQAQRVTPPRLFDAILQMLYLLSCIEEGSTAGVSAFVLEFPDAFRQIPISPAEQKHFCATGLIEGKRKWIAFQRVAQGSAVAPTLWGRLAALVMRLTQSLFEPSKLRLVC